MADGSAGAAPIITDCERVSGARASAGGPEGVAAGALIWRRVRRAPAHVEALRSTLGPSDWCCNLVADATARAAALTARLPQQERGRRAAAAERRRLHDVFARVEVAALAAARGGTRHAARGRRRYPKIGQFLSAGGLTAGSGGTDPGGFAHTARLGPPPARRMRRRGLTDRSSLVCGPFVGPRGRSEACSK